MQEKISKALSPDESFRKEQVRTSENEINKRKYEKQ